MPHAAVLLIEDDADFRQLLVQYLEEVGFTCTQASDGVEGVRMAFSSPPDIVLLDLALPRLDGWEVCKLLRMQSTVPIIVLTGLVSQDEKVRLLRMGADDFLFKPPRIPELVARMEALLRRASYASTAPVTQAGGLALDAGAERALVNGAPVDLSPIEWKVLRFLAQRAGQVVTFDALLEHLWGEGHTRQHEFLQVHVKSLRSKLGDPQQQPHFIETVQDTGYRFIGQTELRGP